MAYSFELLTPDGSLSYIDKTAEAFEAQLSNSWPCWAIGKHHVACVASRLSQSDRTIGNTAPQSKMYNTLLASSRGSICSY